MPTIAYRDEDFVANIGSGYSYMNITIGGIEYTDYNYVGGNLTIYGDAIDGDIVITPTVASGTVNVSASPNSIDITDNNIKLITLQVVNTYNAKLKFNVSINNNKFELVDINGAPLTSFKINANTTTQYSVYVKAVNGTAFYSPTETTNLTVQCNNGINANTNNITIKVPYIDTTPPTIGAINLVLNSSNGNITVNWSGEDDNGGIIIYTIKLYDRNNSLIQTYTYSSSSTSTLTYTINSTDAGKYYHIRIYGEDESGNNGSAYLNEATTTSTYCRKSNEVGRFSVSYTGNKTTTSNKDSYVLAGSTYSNTISVDSGYVIDTYEIIMGGRTLTQGTDYTFNNSVLSIPNVDGNLKITINTKEDSCLVKGTKITLANGKTKNIEDINYTDLLLVWDYEHGKFTYEYPIWIEKEGTSNYYQKTTFSDGSTLNTVGYHGIFSIDAMKFISVDNEKEFHIGTKVLKTIQKNGKYIFEEVQVTDIEYIYKETNYYQIVTTTYYNIISDDFITTDGNVILVNLYGFNNDFKWKTNRTDIITNKENLFEYNFLESVMPYYMFVGLRAAEVKYISNLGYFTMNDVPKLKEKLNYYNKNILLEVPKASDGYRYWMVTTSDDEINSENKMKYLIKEGEDYTLPQPHNEDKFLYWYNTADGKIYVVGEQIKIWTGTHFVAIYE